MQKQPEYVPLVYNTQQGYNPQYNQNVTNQQIYYQAPYQQQTQHYTYNKNYRDDGLSEDIVSLVLFVVGFFTCISWIVGVVMFSKSPNEEARKWAKFSKIAAIIVTIISILSVVGVILVYIILFALIISVDGEPIE